MSRYFTGIGSRDITEDEYSLIVRVSKWLCSKDFILRSGHAIGSDEAFEKGARKVLCNEDIEIYVPWKNFKGADCQGLTIPLDSLGLPKVLLAETVAEDNHPRWENLKDSVKKLHTRNIFQVLGKDLKTPSDFVLFCSDETKTGNVKGGTATAVKVARCWGIPTFNIRGKSPEELYAFLLEQGLTV